MTLAPPHSESRKIALLLTEQEKRLKRIEDGLRTGQLGNASIENGALRLNDENGVTRGVVGAVGDGTWGFLDVNNPNPPSVPSTPTVIGIKAGLSVVVDGTTADGGGFLSDLSHFNVYVAPPSGTYTKMATIPAPGNKGFPASVPITGLEYIQYDVKVTAVNFSNKESPQSAATQGTPEMVVGQDILAGIVDATKLAAEAVTSAALAAGAVTKTKIADGSIETPHLTAGVVQANNIAANQIQAAHLIAGAVTAEKIQALAITGDKIAANTIESGKIAAGAITANKLAADLVLTTRIVAGDPTGARCELDGLAGLQAYLADSTTRSFWLDAATGSAYLLGEFTTGLAGTARIQINPGGTEPAAIRFWNTSTQYGTLSVETAPGPSAAIILRSSGTSVKAAVGCYPTEAFIATQNTTTSVSACSALHDFMNIWGPNIQLDAQSGSGSFIQFTRDGNNTSRLRYRCSSTEPQLYSPQYDLQLTWAGSSGTFIYVGNAAGDARRIIASSFDLASSRTIKKGERPVKFGTQRALDVVNAVVPKLWNYENELTSTDPIPPAKTEIRKWNRTDSFGKLVFDEDGNLIEDSEVIQLPQRVRSQPHVGVMAEDLMLVAPEMVTGTPGVPGGLTINIDNKVGLLWQAMREMYAELVELRNSRAGIKP